MTNVVSLRISIILLAGLTFAGQVSHSQAERTDSSKKASAANLDRPAWNASVTTLTIKKAEDYWAINAEYPEINDVPKEVNEKMQGMVKRIIKDFEKKAAEHARGCRRYDAEWKSLAQQYPNLMTCRGCGPIALGFRLELTLSYQVAQMNDDYISLLLIGDEHYRDMWGMPFYQSFNYDLKNKKELKLANLFPNDKDYLKRVSTFCNSEILKRLSRSPSANGADMKWLGELIAPDAKSFEKFTFTHDSITIVFAPYQVAYCTAGRFEVEMPRE